MRKAALGKVTTSAGLVLLLLASGTLLRSLVTETPVVAFPTEAASEDDMLQSEWVDKDGVVRRVISKWKEYDPDETWDEFLTRHDNEVNAALLKWPME